MNYECGESPYLCSIPNFKEPSASIEDYQMSVGHPSANFSTIAYLWVPLPSWSKLIKKTMPRLPLGAWQMDGFRTQGNDWLALPSEK